MKELTIFRVDNKMPCSSNVDGVDQNQGSTVFLCYHHDIILFREERNYIRLLPGASVVKLCKEVARCKSLCNHDA